MENTKPQANWINETEINGTRVAVSDKGSLKIGKSNFMPEDVRTLLNHYEQVLPFMQQAVAIKDSRKQAKASDKFAKELGRLAEKHGAQAEGYLQAQIEELQRAQAALKAAKQG